MVKASIENPPVSITLGKGESVTVPDGEVWKVNICLSGHDSDGKNQYAYGSVIINGKVVLAITGSDNFKTDTVLTGGDTVSLQTYYSSNEPGCHIGGFVVN